MTPDRLRSGVVRSALCVSRTHRSSLRSVWIPSSRMLRGPGSLTRWTRAKRGTRPSLAPRQRRFQADSVRLSRGAMPLKSSCAPPGRRSAQISPHTRKPGLSSFACSPDSHTRRESNRSRRDGRAGHLRSAIPVVEQSELETNWSLITDDEGLQAAAALIAAELAPSVWTPNELRASHTALKRTSCRCIAAAPRPSSSIPSGFRLSPRLPKYSARRNGSSMPQARTFPVSTELGLHPDRLFDTELAARLLGYDRVGLGAIVEQLLGIHLEKAHSAADWSQRPLPESWWNMRRSTWPSCRIFATRSPRTSRLRGKPSLPGRSRAAGTYQACEAESRGTLAQALR